jgi:hypothetical protein
MKAEDESDVVTALVRSCDEELKSITQFGYLTTADLVREAGLCHKSGAFVACAVVCRGAMQSILHELRAWRKVGDTYELDNNYLQRSRSQTLEGNIRWAHDERLISAANLGLADDIRNYGNFAAHLREHIDRQIQAHLTGRWQYQLLQPYGLWIDEKESFELLKETSELVVAIAKNKAELESARPSEVQLPWDMFGAH